MSFCLGVLFAYFANKYFTFKRDDYGLKGKGKFTLVYATSLIANISVNYVALKFIFPQLEIRFIIAFVMATGISAIMNFLGMKLYVFKGRDI